MKKKNLKILHCNTAYPTPYENVNLNVINKLKNIFKVDIGYSDHTKDFEVSLAAVAMGAKIIEKHFTLNKKMSGPDHSSSLDPISLSRLIKSIRNIELAKGSFVKKITNSEKKMFFIFEKVFSRIKNYQKGENFQNSILQLNDLGGGIYQ